MANQAENPTAPKVEQSKAAKARKDEQMKRIADKAAARGREREKSHDLQHGPFPRGGPSGMA